MTQAKPPPEDPRRFTYESNGIVGRSSHLVRAMFLYAMAIHGVAFAKLPVERAQVVRTYPHSTDAFTEGLFIKGGYLYESTGLEGKSSISKIDLATGRVVASVRLAPNLFGEGICDWGTKIFSLTWKNQQGFTWNADNLSPIGKWKYSGEGWGLTRYNGHLVMSDGSPTLHVLDPRSKRLVGTIKVTAEGRPVQFLNELEFVQGEILANIWQTSMIARIDPASGRVKGWLDLSALVQQVGAVDTNAVANGIAYDATRNKLYVTGKNWPVLFEIALPR